MTKPGSITIRQNLVGMDRQLYHYVHHPESPLLESKNRLQPTPTTYQPSEIGQAEIRLGKGDYGARQINVVAVSSSRSFDD